MIPAEGFSFACYRFTLRLANAVRMPGYKGDIFHRALGHGLAQVGPRFGQLFYQPQKPPDWPHPGQTPPKPFMLIPPLEERQDYGPGDTMELGLILYGEALQYFMIAFAALEAVGRVKGLTGGGHGCFTIQQVTQLHGGTPRILFQDDQWWARIIPTTARDIFGFAPNAVRAVTVHSVTRIRLKNRGGLVRDAPPLTVLTERLLGRVNTLAAIYCGGLMLTPDDKTELATLAAGASIEDAHMRWRDWRRPGGREGEAMQFGGLLGRISYRDVPAPLLPWLSLGQWIGVGGKTSFGLGLYEMTAEFEGLA